MFIDISGEGIGDLDSDIRGVDFSITEEDKIDECILAFFDGAHVESLIELEELDSLRLVLLDKPDLSGMALVTWNKTIGNFKLLHHDLKLGVRL